MGKFWPRGHKDAELQKWKDRTNSTITPLAPPMICFLFREISIYAKPYCFYCLYIYALLFTFPKESLIK